MKKQITITIREVDNGFTVVSQRPGIANGNATKVAANEVEAVKLATEIINTALINQPKPE